MIHTCEFLEYKNHVIKLVYPGTAYQRWVLSTGFNDARLNDEVILQVVMFCPYCGEDFRADCHWQIPGRPGENEILNRARLAGANEKEI